MTFAGTPLHCGIADVLAATRRAHWRYPEWPLVPIAITAWMAIFALDAVTPHGQPSQAVVHSHTVRNPAGPSVDALHVTMSHWILMVLAMMLPTILPAARAVALGSRWRRRHRGQAIFTFGYLAPWVALGVVTATALPAIGQPPPRLFSAALVVAALWELTGWKVLLLRACHRLRPLPPDGWRADTGCLARGLVHAGTCIGACWALMAAMIAAGHESRSWLMLPVSALIMTEKFTSRPDRVVRPVAAGLVVMAAIALLI
jgi:predicted metal-binding membrane protein